MTATYALLAAVLAGCALYMILSRNLVRMMLGLSLLATAVNLMLFLSGRIGRVQPPIIPDGQSTLPQAATDPVPQALILTAIVIGVALTVTLTVLIVRTYRAHGTLASDAIRAADTLGDPLRPESKR